MLKNNAYYMPDTKCLLGSTKFNPPNNPTNEVSLQKQGCQDDI